MRALSGLTVASALLLCAVFIATSSFAAKGGGGKGKSSSASTTPPGWSHGKKTGWGEGKYPPGWSKWDEGRKAKWSSDRETALTDIDGVCVRYRIQEQKRNQISQAFDEAIAGGLVINEARKKLVSALQNEEERRALMIDTTQSVLELLK